MITEYALAIRQLDRNVRLSLVVAAVVGFTAWGGIYPTIFNLYLLRLGFGPEAIGLVNAAGSLAFALACIPAGLGVSRLGSRRAMLVGMCFAGVAEALMPQAGIVAPDARLIWLLVCNMLGASGLALYAVSTGPYLMAAAPPELRNYAFSIQVAIWPLAAFAGSLIGGIMPSIVSSVSGAPLTSPAPYRIPLMMAAACFVLGALAVLGTTETGPADERTPVFGHGRAPLVAFGFISVVLLLQGSGEAAARTFFNVYLDEALQALPSQIGLLASFGQLISVPAALLTPWLTVRFGRPRVFVGASLGIAASLLPLALIPLLWAAGLGFAGVMSTVAVARAIIIVYQFELVTPRWRAMMGSASTLSIGMSGALVAYGGGLIIAQRGFSALFLGTAALTALSSVVFVSLRPRVEAVKPHPVA